MDNGFKRWLEQKLQETLETIKLKQQKRNKTEEFVRNIIIPEAIEFLEETKAIIEKNGFKVSLEYGKDWFELKMYYGEGFYIGIALQLNMENRNFELVELLNIEDGKYMHVLIKKILPETWAFTEFKGKIQYIINKFLLKVQVKY
jgi:hypothetical protein